MRLRRQGTSGRPAAHRAAFLRGAPPRRGAPLPAGERLASARAEGNAAVKWLLLLVSLSACAQETTEMIGQLGNRTTLLVLHSTRSADGALRLTGEYVVLPSLQRRFVDGEASPEIGVTTL